LFAVSLKDLDVDALLALRANVEGVLAGRAHDLQRQIALLDGSRNKRPGRPAGGPARASTLKNSKVPPKYRGPGGETWAGRGAKPRWLRALLGDGHSIEEFAIARKGGKVASAAAKKLVAKERGTKPTRKVRPRKQSPAKGESAPAE
jgi:DNA-binding protein H-NS